MSNKNLYIGIAALVIAALVGGYIVLSQNSSSSKQAVQPTPSQEEVVPTIAPSELGLSFTARTDKKAVKFVITNIKDITSVDYEVTYFAKGDIPRGAIGHLDVKPGDEKIETKYIDLGTCSSGKCKYDEGVKSVKLVLKITKSDGKVYQAEKTLDLESSE